MSKKSHTILTYNINGIRAAIRKGITEWLANQAFDIVCFQETKASPDQFDTQIFEKLGYHHYWYAAEKKGYSSLGILSKKKAEKIHYGCGIAQHDKEARVMRMDIGDLTIVNAYFPSGSSGDVRQAVKMQFLEDIFIYIKNLRKERSRIILCGDYNICHKAIDIHDPVRNKKSSGFLPEEREWMSKLFDSGFIDVFRHFNPDPDQYSWWSYRAGARARNKGWRLDYHAASVELKDDLLGAGILSDAMHSDHAPVYMKLKI